MRSWLSRRAEVTEGYDPIHRLRNLRAAAELPPDLLIPDRRPGRNPRTVSCRNADVRPRRKSLPTSAFDICWLLAPSRSEESSGRRRNMGLRFSGAARTTSKTSLDTLDLYRTIARDPPTIVQCVCTLDLQPVCGRTRRRPLQYRIRRSAPSPPLVLAKAHNFRPRSLDSEHLNSAVTPSPWTMRLDMSSLVIPKIAAHHTR